MKNMVYIKHQRQEEPGSQTKEIGALKMEIVKVQSLEEINGGDVYYELNGKFYAICFTCGKPVEVDHHRTSADLRREDICEEIYFCDRNCKNNHPDFSEEDDRFFNFNGKFSKFNR